MNDRYSKLAFLHRVKEGKTPSLSAQASFAPFSLKVAWSGKSLIRPGFFFQFHFVKSEVSATILAYIYWLNLSMFRVFLLSNLTRRRLKLAKDMYVIHTSKLTCMVNLQTTTLKTK